MYLGLMEAKKTNVKSRTLSNLYRIVRRIFRLLSSISFIKSNLVTLKLNSNDPTILCLSWNIMEPRNHSNPLYFLIKVRYKDRSRALENPVSTEHNVETRFQWHDLPIPVFRAFLPKRSRPSYSSRTFNLAFYDC